MASNRQIKASQRAADVLADSWRSLREQGRYGTLSPGPLNSSERSREQRKRAFDVSCDGGLIMSQKLLIPLSVLVLMVMTSCVTTSRFSEPFVTVEAKVVNLSGVGPGLAAVTCPETRKLIGGGFLVSTASNPRDYLVRGSHPSPENSWMVEVENFQAADDVIVEALAYCLDVGRVPATITTQISRAAIQTGGAALGHTAGTNATCPGGTSLTGGGFRIGGDLVSGDTLYNAGIQESSPTPSAWSVGMDPRLMAPDRTLTFESFAVCATSPISPGTVIREPLPIAGDARAVAAPKCDAASFVTAGGFYQDPYPGIPAPMVLRAFESASTSDFQEWTVDLFAPVRNALDQSNFKVVSLAGATALCLPIPALN
jgi:hypothetical protein